MRRFIALFLLAGPWLSATAAPAVTVQDALSLLPKDQVKNLVRIEARDGTPAPDRWYVQVYDPGADNGLREFVIAEKVIVASRPISQFLAAAKPDDVIGAKLVKVDSGDLIKLVQKYTEANSLDVAKINYTMLKEADSPAPVWKMACFDDSGKKLGEIVVNARNAIVVSHEGFDIVPAPAKTEASSESRKPVVKPAVAVKPSPVAIATPKPAGFFHRLFGGGKPAPPP